jgi:type III restriction enzyme
VFLSAAARDIVPNPWLSFETGRNAIERLRTRYKNDQFIAANFVFVIEELRKILEAERDRLSREVFEEMIEERTLFFYIIDGEPAVNLSSRPTIRSFEAPYVTTMTTTSKNHCSIT